jgi:hypothetical protein
MPAAPTIENLDFYCVDYAKRVVDTLTTTERVAADEVAHLITKLLSILHANGLYAYLLYVIWKKHSGTGVERKIAAALDRLLVGQPGEHSLLRIEPIGLPLNAAKDALEAGKTLSQNLNDLFLARDLLDRTLVYARYQAKGLAA